MKSTHWVVTADARHATLFGCHRRADHSLALEQVSAIENPHEAEHERHRPNLLGGAERKGALARSAAHAAPHSVAEGHAAEEEQRRFAREIGKWLRTTVPQPPNEPVILFAPPRYVQLLREQLVDWEPPADIRTGNLAHLQTHDLAAHPLVLDAVLGET